MKTKKRYTESEQRSKTHKATALIEAKGLTKRDAAKAVGVTPLTLAKWMKKFTDNDDQVGALDVPPQDVRVANNPLVTELQIENRLLKGLLIQFAQSHR